MNYKFNKLRERSVPEKKMSMSGRGLEKKDWPCCWVVDLILSQLDASSVGIGNLLYPCIVIERKDQFLHKMMVE